MNRIRVLLSALLVMFVSLLCFDAFAAKPVPPPIEELFNKHYQVAIVEFKSALKDNQYQFKKVSDISGQSADEVTIRSSSKIDFDFISGEKYLVGYTKMRRQRFKRKLYEEDPQGARFVRLAVVKEAVFDVNNNIRLLFDEVKNNSTSEKFIEALLLEMQNPKSANRGLALLEFNIRNDLYPQLSDKHLKTLAKIGSKRDLSDQQQELLLSSTSRFPKSFDGHWVAKTCRLTIKDYGSQYDLVTYRPLLVRSCTQLLARYGNEQDIELLSSLIDSNNPSVAKYAFNTIASFDVNKAAIIAKANVELSSVHIETRSVLASFLQ